MLEWISRQFIPDPPDPTTTIDSLLDPAQDQFDFLLTWAYLVWIARYRFYHNRWAYARTKEAPTWWLDHPITDYER